MSEYLGTVLFLAERSASQQASIWGFSDKALGDLRGTTACTSTSQNGVALLKVRTGVLMSIRDPDLGQTMEHVACLNTWELFCFWLSGQHRNRRAYGFF